MISLILSFVLLAHWLGLGYHVLAIKPLELQFQNDTARGWIWAEMDDIDMGYGLGLRYICSIYWSLSVMTNTNRYGLSGHPCLMPLLCFLVSLAIPLIPTMNVGFSYKFAIILHSLSGTLIRFRLPLSFS